MFYFLNLPGFFMFSISLFLSDGGGVVLFHHFAKPPQLF